MTSCVSREARTTICFPLSFVTRMLRWGWVKWIYVWRHACHACQLCVPIENVVSFIWLFYVFMCTQYIKEPYKRDYIQLCVPIECVNCVRQLDVSIVCANWHIQLVRDSRVTIDNWQRHTQLTKAHTIGTHNWQLNVSIVCANWIHLTSYVTRMSITVNCVCQLNVSIVLNWIHSTWYGTQFSSCVGCAVYRMTSSVSPYKRDYSQLCVPIECVNCVELNTLDVIRHTQLTHSIGTHNWL